MDRAFATNEWWAKFPLHNLKVINVPVSDHEPLKLDLLKTDISSRNFRFRFENVWLKEPGFIREVTDIWHSIPVMHIIPKLNEVTAFMARWGRSFFHKFREKLKLHKANLDRLVDREDEIGVQEYLSERSKLNELLAKEELYWKQRAKLFWLKEGDDNTRFFHASATTRKKANKITKLVDDNGISCEDQEGMNNIVLQYFSKLFTEGETTVNLMNNSSTRLITDEQNEFLTSAFRFEEFTAAIKEMHPDKSAGPDGLNPAFYQSFWSVMGKEIFKQCTNWLQTRVFPGELNSTNVVLLPKKENATSMKDLRPIALCNVLYKIIAKVLANRLKVVLPFLISENQSAFIKERSITDNVLIAFEMIHHMNQKKHKREAGEVALKLDISKAYDRVSWSFLKRRMRVMGFSDQWIEWMFMCIKTVTYKFCVNGSLIGPINPRKGLRQGDPLSPYLFLLCVEGLSNAIDDASSSGLIHGCQISPTAPVISHLLFADDSFLFFRGTTEEALNIKELLINYEQSSGQCVNFQKSGIHFSANVNAGKRAEISQILGVSNDIRDSKYLGLPSMVGRSKKRVFNYVKEAAGKRIQGWQAKPISQGGKTVLIRNVAQAIPSYTMTCFLLPKSLCRELEHMYNNYWWRSKQGINQKGLNWLAWNNMSASKSKGGIGFRNLYGFNLALLGKHIWNFCINPNSLVARVYKERYFPSVHVLEATKGQHSSCIWNGIWTAKEELREGFRWVIGSGEDIVATKDRWIRGKDDLKVEQSQFYEGRGEKVSSFFITNEKRWDADKVRNNFLPVDADAILKVYIPQREVTDRVAWEKSSNGFYTAKSAYHYWFDLHFGNDLISQSVGWKKIWHVQVPHKIRVFLWRFCRDAIPVRKRLSSRGVRVPITCPMCMHDIEHMSHLFYDWDFAKGCWSYVGLQVDCSTVEYAPVWVLQKLSTSTNEELQIICMVLWGVWYWRNKKVWEDKTVTPVVAMQFSLSVLSDWIAAKHSGSKPSVRPQRDATNQQPGIWKPPDAGNYKINVDASVFPGAQTYSLGMVMRDHAGAFLGGRTCCFEGQVTVMEAEAMGVREALSWVKDLNKQEEKVLIESDAQLVVKHVLGNSSNLLEVGGILDDTKVLLSSLPLTSIAYIRKNANKVAHQAARIPCLVNSRISYTSPPACLLEALSIDVLV